MNRILCVLAAFALLAVTPAVARDWTDTRGNKMTAKFVRIHQGNVVLSRGGRVVTLRFSDLCQEDQEYLREEAKKKGQEDQLPAARHSPIRPQGPGAGEASGEDEEMPGNMRAPAADEPVRTWTDVSGRTIEAQFVELSGADVVLIKDGQRVSYPIMGFSMADQQYVAMRAATTGAISPGPGFDGSPQMENYPGMGEEPSAEFPASNPYNQFDHPSDKDEYESDDEQYADDSDMYGSSREEEYGHSGGNPGMRSPQPAMGSHTSHPSGEEMGFEGPRFVHEEVFFCTKCNGELPDSIGAGDDCPHCGAYLAFEEGADGNRTYAGMKWSNGLGSIFIFATIGVFIGILVKVLKGSSS